MSIRRLFLILFVAVAFIAIAGIPTKSQLSGQNNDEGETLLSGRNVNMVAGTTLPDGDPWLQRQNEPSIAVSTRNALHLLAAANDYRTVDVPFTEGPLPGSELETNQAQGDAWIGIFKSFDGGESWKTELLDGYPQLTSSSSPLHGYQAAADPVVRAGTDGLFYVCGMVFQRDPVTKEIGDSAIFVARYIDNNNKEKGDTFGYLGTEIVFLGNPGQMFDKPWMAVDIPRNGGCGNVYVVSADFVGNKDQKAHGKILFSKSTDCGQTWSDPLSLTDAGRPYQGAAIAIDPEVGTIYVALRRFEQQLGKKHILPNAIFVTKSTDFGQSFSNPVEVAEINPFDQPTMTTMFRTNCYPTMAVDDAGVVYVAWSQKQPEDGKARVVISTSTSGSSWSAPTPVELTHPSHPEGLVGHQFMPTMAYANGKLMLAWYDSRYDKAGNDCWFGDYIMDDPGCDWRHTIDVRIAQANPGTFPIFEPSIQVSRYIWVVVQEPGNGEWSLVQGQWNPPNYPLFRGGTTPFHGDYIDMSASPMFIWDEMLGKWLFNTEPTDAPVFHVTWTDNRDVSPPWDVPYDWTEYTPTDYYNEEFSTGGSPECGGDWRPGMRNQNIYTSKVSWGLEVGSTGNSKPLNIPRAFIIEVNNTTDEVKSFRLVIGDPGPDGQASFLQFGEGDPILELDVEIAPYSSISRPVFFQSSDPNSSLRVDVVEIFEPGGNPDAEGLTSFIILNPGDTEAVIEDPDGWEGPPVELEEVYDPVIELSEVFDWSNVGEFNPGIWSPGIWSPGIWSPSMYWNTIVVNPTWWNPGIWSPGIWSPGIWSPGIWSPGIWSPGIWSGAVPEGTNLEGAKVVDVVWTVKNEGNTTSSYTFKTFAKAALPEGIYVQLLVYKTTYMPVTNGVDCEQRDAPQTKLLANITNPGIWSPGIWSPGIWSTNMFNAAIENATFSIPPGDEVNVLLRLIEENPAEVKTLQTGEHFDLFEFAKDTGGGVTQQQVNTSDAAAGIKIPRAAATKLLLGTAALPDGSEEIAYTGYVDAVGGDSDYYTYSLNSGELPPGLNISTGYTPPYPYLRGIISGYPTTAGTYHFVVQVDDGSETDNQAYKITIHEGAVPDTPTITTPSPLPNAIQGVYYGVGLTASGGQLPYIWTLEPGSLLPDDLSLDQSGAITGKPEDLVKTHTFTVGVTDQDGDHAIKEFSLEIREFTGTDITISGMIYDTDNQPLNDVVIRGLPNTPITGSGEWDPGYYEDSVPEGWEGTARPFKIDHTFDPETREYSSGDTIIDIPNQNYNSVLPGATITGTLKYNGNPLVPAQVPQGQGNHEVSFWGYQGEGDWDFTAIYNYDDGTFTINGVQPGDYSLSVKVDPVAPFDFGQLPGNFRGDYDFSVPEGQPTWQIDLPCQIYMHLTSPVDGSNAGPYTIPPTHSWISPVTFTWDAVAGAQTYTYTINKVYTDGTPTVNLHYGTTAQTSWSISLNSSGANDYYSFHILAMNPDEPPDQLGRLSIVWDTNTTSSYFFTVETPTPADSDIYIEKDGTEIPDDGSYDFGWHRIDTDTDAIFTIQNVGTAELTFGSIHIAGANPDQFHIQQQPSSIPAGQSDSLIVRFTPTSDGAKTALLTIMNNDPDDEGQYEITLNGTGYGSESYIMFLSTFDEDTAGNPPQAGGAPDQPTNLQVPSGGSILVQSAANGLATQPVEISDGGTQAYGSVDYSFSPFSSGILYIEATISIGDRPEGRATGFLLQTYDDTGPVTILSMTHHDGTIKAMGIPIGPYIPDKPFRIYQTVDMNSKKWSVAMDDEMNGFDDDTLHGDLEFVRPANMISNVSEVRASLDVQDTFTGETRVSYDDIFIGEGAVYPSGMVTYWKFEEGDGNIAFDAMGTANGTVYGATWTAGQAGGALNFDGLDDYVDVGIHDFLNSVNDFSYSVWIRPSVNIAGGGIPTDRSMIISLHNGPYLNFELASGKLRSWLFIGSEQYLETNKAVWDQDTWYHIGVTFGESEWKIYVNGELDNERSGGLKNPVGDNSHIKIGRNHWQPRWYFNGLMDEFAIFNRALSPVEVQRHYLNGLLGRGYEEPGETFNVSGHVYYSTTGLAGVTVELIEGDISGPVIQTTTTDGSGYYKFSQVRLGPYYVKVYKPAGDPDFIDWKASTVTVTDGDATRDIDLPKKLTLLTPSSGSDVSDTTPELTWQAKTDASKYTVQLNVTSPWTLVEQTSNIFTTNYTVQNILTVGENYSWQVDAYDSANHHVGTTQTAFTFTVIVPPDLTPPTVTDFDPADDASGVAIDSNLVITFDENVVADTGNIVIYKFDDTPFETIGVTEAGKVAIVDNVATIDPSGTFEAATGYYVQVATTCFKDTAGNHYIGITDKTTWNFSTITIGDLVAYYPFNGNANDESGNGNHGIIHGGATFVDDRFGNSNSAVNFDGVDDYVELPNESNFDLTEFSIIAILKVPDYSRKNYIISKGDNYGNYTIYIYETGNPWGYDGRYSYAHRTATGNWSSGVMLDQVPQNKFFHVAVTLNSTVFKNYLNGELKRNVPNPTPPVLNDDNVTIGKAFFTTPEDFFFLGDIDEIRIYNRALSESEIEALYNQSSPGIITTVAGDGTVGFSGDGGPAASAQLDSPGGIAVDSTGNIFIADEDNHRIRRVDANTGVITTVAGNGSSGFSGDGGAATSASLYYPRGVALDSNDNLYIADTSNDRIRMVDATTGIITTVTGPANLSDPEAVAIDDAGNIYIGRSTSDNEILMWDASTGIIDTLAGDGSAGYDSELYPAGDEGGLATEASLYGTGGVALDSQGNLYFSSFYDCTILKVNLTTGIITTAVGVLGNSWAGWGCGYGGDGESAVVTRENGGVVRLDESVGVFVDSAGNLYIADTGNDRIRRVDGVTGIITTIAGNGSSGYSGDGGVAISASLNCPRGVAVDSQGNLYIVDTDNNRIRKVIKNW